MARQGGLVEGIKAVNFFKLTNVSQQILREIWNLSSVFRTPHLCKEEFYIYMKYLALAQHGYSTSYESLVTNCSKVDGPRFTGIPMPPPIAKRQQSLNPFDMFDNDNNKNDEEDDTGFDDFQEAKSTHEVTSTSSKAYSISTQPPPMIQPLIQTNNFLSQMQEKPQLQQQQNSSQSSSIVDLLDLNFKQTLSNLGYPSQQVQQPQIQQQQQQLGQYGQPLTFQSINSANLQQQISLNNNKQETAKLEIQKTQESKLPEEETPKNHEDIIFQQLKNAKFAHQIQPSQKNDDEGGWDTFQTSEDQKHQSLLTEKNIQQSAKNRLDLIRDAFADILEDKIEEQKTQQNSHPQTIPSFTQDLKQNQTTFQQDLGGAQNANDDSDSFDDFIEATPTQNQEKDTKQNNSVKLEDHLLGFGTSNSQPVSQTPLAQKVQQPAFIHDLLSLYSNPAPVQQQPSAQIDLLSSIPGFQTSQPQKINENSLRIDEQDESSKSQHQINTSTNQQKLNDVNDEEGFDDFQDADGQISSQPDLQDNSRMDSNIFSTSRQDMENYENSFAETSQDYGNQGGNNQSKFKPDQNWLQQLASQSSNVQEMTPKHENMFQQQDEEDEDDGFGDWTESKNNGKDSNQSPDLHQNQGDNNSQVISSNKQKNQQNLNILELDDQSYENSVSINQTVNNLDSVPAEPPKPKVELNENNLLSGFMMEFGKSLVSQSLQAQSVQKQLKHDQDMLMKSNKQELMSLHFDVDESLQKQLKLKPSDYTYENKASIQEEIDKKLQAYYSSQSAGADNADYSKLDDAQLESMSQNTQKLNDLQKFLINNVELPESEVSIKINHQQSLLLKMEKKNKKKTQAAVDEDFELAAKYRNQFNLLKTQLIKVDELRSMFQKKPELTERQLIDLIIEHDNNLHFSRNLVDHIVEDKIKKPEILSYYLQVINVVYLHNLGFI
eukprot:403355731